jgi:hypothetical protein
MKACESSEEGLMVVTPLQRRVFTVLRPAFSGSRPLRGAMGGIDERLCFEYLVSLLRHVYRDLGGSDQDFEQVLQVEVAYPYDKQTDYLGS